MNSPSPLAAGLLAAANSLLEHNQPDQAAACLQAALKIQPDCLTAHNLLEANQLPGALGHAFGIKGQIHPEDDIFHFFSSHFSSTNPIRDYLSDGWRTLSELQSILSKINISLSNVSSFLEFASGHGRFTRHLVNQLPQHSLTVSDVVTSSVPFLTQTFGVKGFLSALDPMELHLDEKFDMIFVLSLFSHLPAGLWESWLKKLFDAVNPGGHLIISTHGEYSAQQLGVEMSGDDYKFIANSESKQIDKLTYGSTFTTARYVNKAIKTYCSEAKSVQHFPTHFWSNQDAWVVTKS